MTAAQQQFDEGNYTETISILNKFLESNSKNIEAINLRGKAYYQLAFQTEIEEEGLNFLQLSLADFNTILTKIRNHREALLYRAFILTDYIFDQDDVLLEDANLLLDMDDDCKFKALNYLAKVNYRNNKLDEAIDNLKTQADHLRSYTTDNLAFLQQELGGIYARVATIYNAKNNHQESLLWDKKAFEIYPYNHHYNLSIAQYALEHKNYDLAGKTMHQYLLLIPFAGDNGFDEVMEKFQNSHDSGIKNQNIDSVIMLGNRMSGIDVLDQISFAKTCLSRFPENSDGYHILGTLLFDQKSYKEALVYFDKIVKNKTCYALSLARYIICKYYTEGKIPNYPNLNEINPDPIDFYSAGILLKEAINYKNDKFPVNDFRELSATFYGEGYKLFYEYFYENKGLPNANHAHYFAMLCNNYGIVLCDLDYWEKAINIHQIGYSQSPFWEQMNSLANAYFLNRNYQDAIQTDTSLLNEYGNYISTDRYVAIYNRMIKSNNLLLQFDEAHELALKILAEKDTLQFEILQQNPDDFGFYNEQYIEIESSLEIAKQKVSNKNQEILALEKRMAEDPENTYCLFLLFQKYSTINNFQQALTCADLYLKLCERDKFVIQDEQMQVLRYFRGNALRNLGKIDEAIVDLKISYDLNPTDEWAIYGLSNCYFTQKEIVNSRKYGQQYIDFYVRENFEYDEKIGLICFTLIDLYQEVKDKNSTLEILDALYFIDPKNQKAAEIRKNLKKRFLGLF